VVSTASAQIVSDGLSDVHGQRQNLVAGTLAVHHQLTCAPVDVVQADRADLPRA